jgi:hypothetical protein
MDFHISAEQRQTVRDMAQVEFKPKSGRWMDDNFPLEHMHATIGMIRGGVSNSPPGMT